MKKQSIEKFFLLSLLGLGVFLRLNHYFDHLSFWADEAWLAIDLSRRSLLDIVLNNNLSPHLSIPPIGFLVFVKLCVVLGGYTEYAFRLVPLTASLFSLLFYTKLLRGHFQPRVCFMAITLFVFSNPLIFYAAELKQYSSDVFFSILPYMLCFSLLSKQESLDIEDILWSGVFGFICILFSHPSIFILAGVAMAQLIILIREKAGRRLRQQLVVFVIWGLSFLLIWFLYFRAMFANPLLTNYHTEHYLSTHGPVAGFMKVLGLFEYSVGLAHRELVAVIFLVGMIALFRKNHKTALTLFMPVLLTISGVAWRKISFSRPVPFISCPGRYYFYCRGI